MSAGCLCWLDKQNTVAAYFIPVPVCQAVCGEEGIGSERNGEFDTVMCLDSVCLTVLFTFTPTSPLSEGAEGTGANIVEDARRRRTLFNQQCRAAPHFAAVLHVFSQTQ